MSLIRGIGGKAPCPVCIVKKEQQHELYAQRLYPLRDWKAEEKLVQQVKSLPARKQKAESDRLLKEIGLRPVEVCNTQNSTRVTENDRLVERILESSALQRSSCALLGSPSCVPQWAIPQASLQRVPGSTLR